jgi:xanthine/uracil permease
VAIIIGSGMVGGLAVKFGTVSIDGIGLATFSAIILYQILRERHPQPEEAVVADSAVGLYPTREGEDEERH